MRPRTPVAFATTLLALCVGAAAADTHYVDASNPTIATVDAEDNWWGDGAGPLDTSGTDEAGSAGCFPPAPMKNDNGLADAEIFAFPAGVDNVDYCPWLSSQGVLTLEVDDVCQGDAGDVMYVEVWMRDVTPFATGWYAEIDYDPAKLAFNVALSTYTTSPFAAHLTPMSGAEGTAGELQLDGSTFSVPPDPPAKGDALLATLCFDVLTGCETTEVVFDSTPLFISELSFEGLGLVTALVDAPIVTFDDTPPVVTDCPDDIVAEAPPCEQYIGWPPPDVTDNCDGSPSVVYEIDFDDDGSIDETVEENFALFPVGVHNVVVRATDECGNTNTVCTFQVTLTGSCPADCAVPCNGRVDILDFLTLLDQWGLSDVSCDIIGDTTVDILDFLALLAAWGPCP